MTAQNGDSREPIIRYHEDVLTYYLGPKALEALNCWVKGLVEDMRAIVREHGPRTKWVGDFDISSADLKTDDPEILNKYYVPEIKAVMARYFTQVLDVTFAVDHEGKLMFLCSDIQDAQ